MTFFEFLLQIKSQTATSHQSLAFLELCEKYSRITQLPIQLLDEEINCLVDLISLHEPSLLQFISMGTATNNADENIDPMLGVKDPRIEQAIIAKAIEKQHQLERLSHKPAVKKAIFGLSGNPPTLNHLAMIKHLCQNQAYDLTLAIINAQSTLKAKSDYANAADRYAMLQNMLQTSDIDPSKYQLSRIEIDRTSPSRMVVSLSALILLSSERQKLDLILGRDALTLKNGRSNLTYWYGFENLGKLCHIKFYPREGEELSISEMAQAITPLLENNISFSLVFRNEVTKNVYATELSGQLDVSAIKFEVATLTTTKGSATEIRNHYKTGLSGCPEGLSEINDCYIREKELFVSPDQSCTSSKSPT